MKKKLFLMLPLALVFFACTENDPIDNPVDTPTDEGSVRHLQRMDCTITEEGIVTSWYNTYLWDGDNLIQVLEYDDEGDLTHQIDFIYENGKVISSTVTYNNNEQDSYIYHYIGDKVDYVEDYVHDKEFHYTYSGDKITTIECNGSDDDFGVSLSWTGDNITQLNYYPFVVESNYVYDNKRNPLYLPMGIGYREMATDYGFPMWCKNNFTSYSDSWGENVTITYIYDGDYPIKQIESSEGCTEEHTFTYSD